MDRRSFFKLATAALAGEAARRVWPFRVYSIPSEIKLCPFGLWASFEYSKLTELVNEGPDILHEHYFIGDDGDPLFRWVPQDDRNADDVAAAKTANLFPRVIASRHAPLDRIYLLPRQALRPPPEPIWHEGPPQIEPGIFDYLDKLKDQMAVLTGVQPTVFGDSEPSRTATGAQLIRRQNG